jgi:hypothetical protein
LHDDLLTDIIELDNVIVSCSIDGSVVFTCLHSRTILKRLQFEQILWNIKHLNDYIYVSGNPSLKINRMTYDWVELPHFTMFERYN